MLEPFVSRRTLTIEWGDCDPADIVYSRITFGGLMPHIDTPVGNWYRRITK